MSMSTSYVCTHIYIEDMLTKKVLQLLNEAFLVKIANSNFMPTLCGFHWYPYFCSSGAVSGIRGKQMTPAVASEQSIFSKNNDYNILNSFPCCGEYVRTYISGSRCMWWQKTMNRHTHTHTHTRGTTTVTIIIKIIRSAEAHKYNNNYYIYVCKTAQHEAHALIWNNN